MKHPTEFYFYNDNKLVDNYETNELFPLHELVADAGRWLVPGFVYLKAGGEQQRPYGVATNNAPFRTELEIALRPRGAERVRIHPAYRLWYEMLKRVYGLGASQSHRICSEWHRFMAFAEWFFGQEFWLDSEGSVLQLDVEYLWAGRGFKIYGPATCLLVTEGAVRHLRGESVFGKPLNSIRQSYRGRKYISQSHGRQLIRTNDLGEARMALDQHIAFDLLELAAHQPNDNSRTAVEGLAGEHIQQIESRFPMRDLLQRIS